MQLTRYTDYALRVLLHVGAQDEGSLSSIAEIASVYAISRNHLMKVVQDLGAAGFLTTVRGRGGGLKLGQPAEHITIGSIVRQTESGFDLVDCSSCIVAPVCSLPKILNEATAAFLTVLDRYTVADILERRADLRGLFGHSKALGDGMHDLGHADADGTFCRDLASGVQAGTVGKKPIIADR